MNAKSAASLVSQTAAIASIMPATEILCRYDPEKRKPVVFISSRNFDGGMIESWISGPATEMSPLSYYHTTLPLSAADEVVLRNRFAKALSDNNVQIRHRLPRTSREVPNRLARSVANSVAAPVSDPSPTPAPTPAPAQGLFANMSPEVRALLEQAAALQAAQTQAAAAPAPAGGQVDPVEQFAQALQDAGATPAEAPAPASRRKSPARKAAKKGGSRKPAAKPIGEATPVPDRALTMRRATDKAAEIPSLEAKVDQLATVVAALTTALGVKVETAAGK